MPGLSIYEVEHMSENTFAAYIVETKELRSDMAERLGLEMCGRRGRGKRL